MFDWPNWWQPRQLCMSLFHKHLQSCLHSFFDCKSSDLGVFNPTHRVWKEAPNRDFDVLQTKKCGSEIWPKQVVRKKNHRRLWFGAPGWDSSWLPTELRWRLGDAASLEFRRGFRQSHRIVTTGYHPVFADFRISQKMMKFTSVYNKETWVKLEVFLWSVHHKDLYTWNSKWLICCSFGTRVRHVLVRPEVLLIWPDRPDWTCQRWCVKSAIKEGRKRWGWMLRLRYGWKGHGNGKKAGSWKGGPTFHG